MSSRVEKLAKVLGQLDAGLETKESTPRKNQNTDKLKILCMEMRDTILSSDFNIIYKEDNRYSEHVNRAIQMVFRIINHSDQNIRTFAEEILDSILRSLLLSFHHYRVLVCLISEVSRNGPARSLIAAYSRLANLIEFSKTNRVISYGVHIANALCSMLKRPEETVQQAIVQHTPAIFNAIGPRMRDQQTEKLFALYQVAADNLELTGTANRAAVVVISQICTYYTSIMQKAFVRCYTNVRMPDEFEYKSRLVGSLNTLKNLWPILNKNYKLFQEDMLKMCLASACCCLYSKQSEIIIASMEFLDVAFSYPLPLMDNFDPTDFSAMFVWKPLMSADRLSLTSSKLEDLDTSSLKSFSTLDISNTESSDPNFNAPLVFPDSPRYHNEDSESDVTETGDDQPDEEIIDPLMHAELYEEVNRIETPPPAEITDAFSTPTKNNYIPTQPPSNICIESANFYVYTAATLGKIFLLAGLKGLKNDRDVRISHKMLALNCLTSISEHKDISDVIVLFNDGQQPLNEVIRFVLHEDDQLCASAIQLMASFDKWNPIHYENYLKVATSFQVIRKRALLQAFVGKQQIMIDLKLTDTLIELAQAQTNSLYFLIQITCVEFFAGLEWCKLDFSTTKKHQKRCLQAYFELLFASDPKVSKAAVENLSKLLHNADLTQLTSAFETSLPSEPLTNTRLIPAVLNLSTEYNFFNESANYVLEANLEVILSELMSYYIEDCETRSHSLCSALEHLMKTFPPTIYYEVWGGNNKAVSSTPHILTAILDKCESSFSSASAMATGLNVISKMFAGMCEGYMVQVVREQATVDRNTLPKLPDPSVLDRILLLALRTINMYYSLIAEHRSILSQASTSLINRPTMSPLASKKASPNRIADISRLMGTNVHLYKKSSYLESTTLSTIFPSIQGAYANYLESLNKENEQKFISLLQSALNCLGCICEMLSFSQLKPIVEEILLYIKVVMEVATPSASALLHQMFKVVFGKNSANINLNCLNSLKMQDPLPPSNKEEMYYLRYANEFTSFSSLISRKDYISSYIHRELGWLKSDMLSKIHVPPSSEISVALEPFEGFITQLRHIYNAYQSVDFKKTVLNVMCELPRNGIIYNMADPKKILLDLVIQQTQDPSFGNMELLTEIILFLIVLARTSVLKFEHIVKIGSDLLEKANEYNAKYVLEGVRVIVLELLYVQQVELDILYNSFNSRSKDFFAYAPDETLYIWMLILHMTDKNSQKSISIDFFGGFSDYLSNSDTRFNFSFTLSAATLLMMSPSMFLPVDNFFKLLQKFLEEKYWGRINIILFVLLHTVEEGPLLMRLDDLIAEPLIWLSKTIVELIEKGVNSSGCNEFPRNTFIHFLQTLVTVFKSDRYKSLTDKVVRQLEDAAIEAQTLTKDWTVYSQLLQLFKFSPKFSDILENVKPDGNNKSHLNELYNTFLPSNKPDQPKIVNGSPRKITKSPVKFATDGYEEIVKDIFGNDSWNTISDIYRSLLLLPPASIYPLLQSMDGNKLAKFIKNLCCEMHRQLEIVLSSESRKKLILTFQEFIDALEEFTKISDTSTDEQIRTFVITTPSFVKLIQQETSLTVAILNGSQIAKILSYAASNIRDPGTIEGLTFVLKTENVRQYFVNNSLANLEQLTSFLKRVTEEYLKKDDIKRYSVGEDFVVHCISEELTMQFTNRTAEELIGELFDYIQHIISNLQQNTKCLPHYLVQMLRILFRHPVLHSLGMVPLAAFKMQWTLRIDVKGTSPSVQVPLVNIHMLCNIDVLHDFSWRINWIGWTSRQQFEDYWMSLFGVLSSTPTGAEIADNQNVTEQILASSLAVSSLTDILLYTLLFPEPGNVPIGTFIVKDREKNNLFYESKAMSQLRTLSGKAREQCPGNLFARNLERLDEVGDRYDLGQVCAMSLWTLTGDLRSSKKDSPERVKISLSEYLLKTASELDTASSVRALFENFSHWFSRGLEFLPLPLLSATVRSMVFLSDLFDETQSYEFLYSQIKVVYRGGFLAHHSDLGYVIYALLKTVTVIGVDAIERTMTEADVAKMILTWVESGFTSKFPFVKTATLHGVLYILQSMAADSLKIVYQYIASFLQAEILAITAKTDIMSFVENNNDATYQSLLWSVAFRLMEEPMQINFRNNLNKLICGYLQSVYSVPSTLEIVTAGVEELILHSATYVPHFLEVVTHCFKEYSTMGHLFPFVLRIFTACVFREELDPRKGKNRKFAAPLEELLSLYRRCDVQDSKRIAGILLPILLRLQTEEQALITIFDLLNRNTLYSNEKATLSMVYEFFQRLRDCKTSSLQEFSSVAMTRAKNFSEEQNNHFIATAILFACSSNEDLANRFNFVLHIPHETFTSSSFQQLLSYCQDRV